jgi:NAD(P)H-flavin reductase
MIAWDKHEETQEQVIHLLVRGGRGFSNTLKIGGTAIAAIVDGPYGGSKFAALERYDKVLFMANGIGIASHLLSIRCLLTAHNDQTARVRRLSVVWFLETQGMFHRSRRNTWAD